MVQLGPAYPPDYKGIPAHIAPGDLAIWYRFRETAMVRLADRVYFDVGLVSQRAPAGTQENIARMWERVTARRIDVLLEYPSRWIIIELRVNASSSALGRLLQYKQMWSDDPPDNRFVELVIVTDRPEPGLKSLVQNFGVKLLTV